MLAALATPREPVYFGDGVDAGDGIQDEDEDAEPYPKPRLLLPPPPLTARSNAATRSATPPLLTRADAADADATVVGVTAAISPSLSPSSSTRVAGRILTQRDRPQIPPRRVNESMNE